MASDCDRLVEDPQLLRQAARPPLHSSQTRIKGFVESMSPTVRGWVCMRGYPNQRLKRRLMVQVMMNQSNQIVGWTEPSVYRADVVKAYTGLCSSSDRHGFEITHLLDEFGRPLGPTTVKEVRFELFLMTSGPPELHSVPLQSQTTSNQTSTCLCCVFGPVDFERNGGLFIESTAARGQMDEAAERQNRAKEPEVITEDGIRYAREPNGMCQLRLSSFGRCPGHNLLGDPEWSAGRSDATMHKTFSSRGAAREANKHAFCIITRVRNYAEWIPEWIEYHHLLGASKIFIVDDCSQDNGLTQRVLQFYHSLEYVEFWEDVGPPVQPHCNDTGRKPHEEALFSFAFTHARQVCDWVAAIDVDEYISFDDTRINVSSVPLHKSIISTLSAQPNPWYKLAWWILLGHGLVNKPPGLMIDNFYNGYFEGGHHKTIARSCAVSQWKFSLWPTRWASNKFEKAYLASFPDGKQTGSLEGTRDASGRLVSAAPMFLKHFIFRSHEEYMRGRGGTARTSNNDMSPWFNNTRAWENGGSGRGAGTLGALFTAQVARLVEQRLRKRKLPFSELRINLSEPVRAEPIRTLATKRVAE
jgi:hypothetical protein